MRKQRWEESEKRREEKKKEDQRRERLRREKIKAREKVVGKHCVFPMICGSEVGPLKRRVPSHLAR